MKRYILALVICLCALPISVSAEFLTQETYAERNFPESEDHTDWFFKAGDIQQDKTTGVVTFRNVKGLLGEYEQADNNIYYIDEETAIYEHTFLNWEEFLSGEQPWITVFITNEDWERIREGKEYRIHIAALHDTSAGVQFFVQAEEKERNRRLSERGIMVGDPDGGFYPYRVLTRAEMAKIAVTMSAPAFRAGSAETVGGFADVSPEHWAHDYIAYAAQKGILQGYPDGSFRPEEKLTYAEAIKILVEMLGYGAVAQEQGGYPQGYLQTAEKLSLTKDLTVMADEAILRQEVAVLADRGLNTPLMKMLEDNTAVVCDGSSPDYPLETLNLLNFKEFEK